MIQLNSLGTHSQIFIRKCFEAALCALESAEVVSFDVFDTLLLRKVLRPIDVFRRMEAELGAGFEGFSERRVAAEQAARSHAPDGYGGEVTLEEIYEALCQRDGPCAGKGAALLAKELALEQSMMRVHPLGKALFDRARELGRRIIFASDMYLPDSVVRGYLLEHGYAGDFELFVSSAYRQSKGQGSLYQTILEQLECSPGALLHIGDNEHADFKMARKFGIRAVHLPKLSACLANADAVRPLGESIVEALALPRFAESMLPQAPPEVVPEGFWQGIGREVAAPLYIAFISHLMEAAKAAGFRRLFFVSRDGKIMKAVYDRLTSGKAGYPKSEYFLASRRASKIASFEHIGKTELDFLIDSGVRLTVRDYLRRIHIAPESVRDVVQACGFSSLDETADPIGGRKGLEALFLALEPRILEMAQAERAAYFGYMDSLGMLEEDSLAFVDVGWNGTIFGALTKLIRMRQPGVRTAGYFFGTFERACLHADKNASLAGYFFEDCAPQANYQALKHSIAICEILFSAEEGSFLRFNQVDGALQAEFDTDGCTADYAEAVRWIQAGALSVIDEYAQACGSAEIVLDRGYGTAAFVRLLTRPSVQEAVAWGDLQFWPEFGAQARAHFMARPSSLLRYLVNPYQMKRHYRKSFWRAGFYRRLPRLHRLVLRGICPDLKFAFKAS